MPAIVLRGINPSELLQKIPTHNSVKITAIRINGLWTVKYHEEKRICVIARTGADFEIACSAHGLGASQAFWVNNLEALKQVGPGSFFLIISRSAYADIMDELRKATFKKFAHTSHS